MAAACPRSQRRSIGSAVTAAGLRVPGRPRPVCAWPVAGPLFSVAMAQDPDSTLVAGAGRGSCGEQSSGATSAEGRVSANARPGAWVTSEMNKTGHSPISITKVVGALATVGWVVVVVLVLWVAVGVGPRSGRSPIQVRCRYVRPRWGRRRPTLVRGVYSGLGMPNLGLGVADVVLVPLVALDATPHGPRSGLRGRCG